ncbi:DUF3152 domain-containing protein [Planosporangium mesophilum]|uniref:DUF3152 domain-containing protein n=1 Tax=Planosporangium mesophilum TaxID=689768 RepID=UPI0027E40236|nr:DUF3152 domain-containing protein [Planosporangium mesophilum]
MTQARHLASTRISYPQAGSRQWITASGDSPVLGRSGRLLRFRVVVERDIDVDPNAFAGEVVTALADPRSWTAGGGWRLQRVGAGGPADFTVHLATPATRDLLCQDGPDRYTSCRRGNAVVLNVARWATGVPGYGAPLDAYRQYMVNHEVGHRLGHGHQLCPGPGKPAPVMQQQTLGLHGCAPNAWPYPDGTQYAGPSGSYHDPLPVER